MATSIRRFNIELYEEHLEEASFLYEQRLAYLHDPELTWLDLDDFEERFEAHIDALVVGGDLALDVCKRRSSAGDFGELHAALRVFCRRDRADLAYPVLQSIDHGDEQTVQAAIDALKADCPESWHADLVRIMLGRCKELVPLLAEVLAYRRVPVEEALLRVLGSCDPVMLPRVLRALGKIGSDRSRPVLAPYLRHEQTSVAEAACRALIRLGDHQALSHALLVAQVRPWPVAALGLAGGYGAVNVLTEIARSDKATEECLLALGMLGEPGSVGTIFNCLGNPELADAAAAALYTITGAPLVEEVFIPDDVDPDELFDEERERYEQTGALPTRPDGRPYGQNVTRLSVKPETWQAWLHEHRGSFDPKLRYRHGRPIGPGASLEALAAERTPNRVRALIAEELAIRYAAPVTLEIDMRVRTQRRHLAALGQWATANAAKFTPGSWYFAGKAAV